MTIWIEIAKFLAGVVTGDLIAHTSLLASNVEPKLLGMHFTHSRNKLIIIADLAVILLLAYIGWFSGW